MEENNDTKISSSSDKSGDNHVKNKTGRGTNFEGKVLYSNNHHRLKGTQGIPRNFEDPSIGFIESFFRACGQCMAPEWDYTHFYDEGTFDDSLSQSHLSLSHFVGIKQIVLE